MLRPIPIDVLMTENEDIGETAFEVVHGYSEVADSRKIEQIIISNINIQVALSDLYPFQTSTDSDTQYKLGFIEGFCKDGQIEQFRYVFSRILVVRLIEGGMLWCTVQAPFEAVLTIFKKLLLQGKLNKWVTHLFREKIVDDVSDIACYVYIPQEDADLGVNPDLNDNEYFQYILFDKHYSCIPVSGLTLQEIDNDPYVKAFSKLVKTLYIYTSRDTINKQTCYLKYMTWEKLNKDVTDMILLLEIEKGSCVCL